MEYENSGSVEPVGPVLSAPQREVLDALRRRETNEYRLSEWYLGALYVLANPHNPDRLSQAAQSLRELVEKLPRVILDSDPQIIKPNFPEERRQIHSGFTRDRERYPDGWRGQQIDSRLARTLNRAIRYFEANQQPTRKEQIQSAVSNIDPLIGLMDSEIRQRKLKAIYELWKRLEDFAHHRATSMEDDFQDCLTTLERIVLDLLAPITAQDQREIQSILALSSRTGDDERRMIEIVERTGSNYAFFFANVEDPTWIPILENREYFSHPLSLEPQDDGGFIAPNWPPVRYLSRVASDEPEEVARIALQIPKVDNPRLYDGIVSIALNTPGPVSVLLKPKVLEYARMDFHTMAHSFRGLLVHWTVEGETSSALELSKALIRFRPDPQADAKEQHRRDNPDDSITTPILMPNPAFNDWEYAEILDKGVRPLAEEEPYEVARALISAATRLLYLKTHRVEIEQGDYNDYSEVWCQRLTSSGDYRHRQSDAALVHALAYACEKVFEEAPESVGQLVQALDNQKWGLFDRIICHLYSRYPNEQTLPWIRKLILNYEDYPNWQYHFEFQLMIRRACECFGECLLTEEERSRIFEAILIGPSPTEYNDQLPERFSEDEYEQSRRNFHLMQLRPFEPVLYGEYRDYFQSPNVGDVIADEDYFPINFSDAETVGSRSPMSVERLAALSDEGLLRYINDWDEKRYERDDRLIRIDVKALAESFQGVFAEFIIPNEDRLRFWMENRERIERPIYIKSIVSLMQQQIDAEEFEPLDDCLSFCEWVLMRFSPEGEASPRSDGRIEHDPQNDELTRSVCDLIGVFVKGETNTPITHRQRLASLLKTLCTQFDYRLDMKVPVIMNRDDQLTEAYNNTRSRALEELFNFGSWAQRNDPSSNIVEVKEILDTRFSPMSSCPLTRPERAILGWRFDSAVALDGAWVTEHRLDFFPRGTLQEWADAFGSFLLSHGPNSQTFEILRDEFGFAIENMGELAKSEHPAAAPIDYFGRHLFIYYLRGYFPLNGTDSLLERYYLKNADSRPYWGRLFDYVGRILVNTGSTLEANLKESVVAFFEWRLGVGEPEELGYFTFWLEAECLEPEWRLESYSRVLDICRIDPPLVMTQVNALGQLMADHTGMVLECFLKITEAIRQDGFNFLNPDTVRQILRQGLGSEDYTVRENATLARENLLRRGWSNLQDIES